MTQTSWTSGRPSAVVASRLRELRSSLDLSAQKLADRCAEHGMPELTRSLITNIENGRRDRVSVDELYVLARALGVSPIHLLAPVDDREASVTPVEHHPGGRVRQWAAGQDPLDSLTFVVEADDRALETRYQRILWTAVERATVRDGLVDAALLERELVGILEGWDDGR